MGGITGPVITNLQKLWEMMKDSEPGVLRHGAAKWTTGGEERQQRAAGSKREDSEGLFIDV